MSQIWPLFLKKAGLKESEMRIVSGDAQTKLNAVINGQADVLLGYVHGPEHEDQGRDGQERLRRSCSPITASTSSPPASSRTSDTLKENADLVRRFMSRDHQGDRRRPRRHPPRRRKAVLKALPKAGKPDTLQEGFELTIPLYRTEETKGQRPFQVSDANMAETVDLLVEYGGVDARRRRRPEGVLHAANSCPTATNEPGCAGHAAQLRVVPKSEACRASQA